MKHFLFMRKSVSDYMGKGTKSQGKKFERWNLSKPTLGVKKLDEKDNFFSVIATFFPFLVYIIVY